MPNKLLTYQFASRFQIVFAVSLFFTYFFSVQETLGQDASQAPLSDSATITPEETSRSSSLFNSTDRPKIFRLPELPSPRFPSLPGFSLLKETASNSYAMTKRTSRRMWNRTKELLRPYDPEPSETDDQNYQVEPTNGGSSWMWWKAQPDEQKIETVNDFLRQERPKL